MSTHSDVIIIGAGTGGEACARRLAQGGKRVTLVERDLIGGETAYWAAIPSPTLLGPANLRWRQEQAAAVLSASLGWPGAAPTMMTLPGGQDDPSRAAALRQAGITLVRGPARILGPGRVDAGYDVLVAENIVVATGSTPRDARGRRAGGRRWPNRPHHGVAGARSRRPRPYRRTALLARANIAPEAHLHLGSPRGLDSPGRAYASRARSVAAREMRVIEMRVIEMRV